jgi:hypothetical protein
MAWTLLISLSLVFRYIHSKEVMVKALIADNWSGSNHYLCYLSMSRVHCVIVDVNGERCEALITSQPGCQI